MTSVLDASTASFGMDMVPRQLLQDSQESVERLKRQLNDALSHRDGEVDIAVHTLQAQLRAMQKQHKTAEDQLNRSLAREKELREQVVNADMLTVISQLRRENKELREKNESLNEQATKGQESEAQIIALRNKLEASLEDLKRVRAGGMRELESTQEEVLALKRALELAQLDNIRNDQMMRQMNALEENMERTAEQLNEKKFQIQALQGELDRANGEISAAATEARTKGVKATNLEREIMTEQKRSEEAIMMWKELEKNIAQKETTISGLEEQLAHVQESSKMQTALLKETEFELSSIQKQMQLLQDNSRLEKDSLVAQLKELKEMSKQTEDENRAAREQIWNELHKAESESKNLRELLRKERDLLEKVMREQNSKETEYNEQRQRYEAQASRRETALQTRLESTEKELDALRLSSVRDSRLRLLQEQWNNERDLLQTRLDIALEDAARAEQQKKIGLGDLEQTLSRMTTEADIATSKVRSLESKLEEAEESCRSERKMRLVACDQLRVFRGEHSVELHSDDIKLTKVAQAAITLVGDTSRLHQSIQKQMAINSRERLDGQQRTAIGIVVVENTVERIIPGSPAEACGMIVEGDEILAVDGKPVKGSAAVTALRGDDLIGGIVSIQLRKQLTKQVLEVHVPRTDIALMQQRQSIMEELQQFRTQAIQAAQNHSPEVLGDRLQKILEGWKALEELDINVQCKLSMQVMEFRNGLNLAIQNAWQAIKQVDKAHQQAHTLQEQTEEELRELLANKESRFLDRNEKAQVSDHSTKLHAQIKALGRDKSLLQHDLSAKDMLLLEAKRDIDRLNDELQLAEHKAIVFEEGQKSMRGTVIALEEQLADAVAEIIEFPYVIALVINLEWDANMCDISKRNNFDVTLQEEISRALRIPTNAVGIICYYREAGQVVAVLKLCSVIPKGENMQSGLRMAKELASELAIQVSDSDSLLQSGPMGSLVLQCTLQGPLSESTVKSLSCAFRDSFMEDGMRQDEMLRLHEEMKRVKQSLETRLAESEAAREALRLENGRISQAAKEGAEQGARLLHQGLLREHQVEISEVKRKHQVDLENLERVVKTKEYEIAVFKEQLTSHDIRNSSINSEKEKGFELARTVQDAYKKLQVTAAQLRELVEPEIKACISTLDNIESEMAFFNAYQLRAMQIAATIGTMGGGSLTLEKDQKDGTYSKEMIERDIKTLREQLEGLAALTSADGELARKLNVPRLSTARMVTQTKSLSTNKYKRFVLYKVDFENFVDTLPRL